MGGVGVVVIDQHADGSREPLEVSTSVSAVFSSANIPGLRTEPEIAGALDRLHNILAELAGLHHALTHVREGAAATIVYDYKGIGEWMERRWRTKDDVVTAVIAACHREVRERSLDVTYLHQRGHQKAWVGRDDFAYWNGRADELATLGASPQEQ
jgi:ribonuclease HI